ncbi:MAG: hypothetical protein KF799_06545 [Bdellovibrionales bacterium]|nr:hypothetical protein [Bdellovibrionales bacterium]
MDKKHPHDKERHHEREEEDAPKWSEMVRKVMSVGLGAAFMTEESVRSALGGLNLPKEVLSTILSQANRGKEDLLNRIGNETIKLISKIDFVKEASRFVEEHKFRINAEIEVVKKESSDSALHLKTKVKIQD